MSGNKTNNSIEQSPSRIFSTQTSRDPSLNQPRLSSPLYQSSPEYASLSTQRSRMSLGRNTGYENENFLKANYAARDNLASSSMARPLGSTAKAVAAAQKPQTKPPLGSFYNVSSDEGGDSDSDGGDDLDDGECAEDNRTNEARAAAFQRRSMKLRQSQDKAKAALPADFADRIGIAPDLTESAYRDQLATFPSKDRASSVPLNDGVFAEESYQSVDEEIEHDMAQDENTHSTESNIKEPPTYFSQPGIQWSSESSRNLDQIMPELRQSPPGTAHLVKAISQRTGCRCALCGHDSLLLFPVLDASLALAHWCTWSITSKPHGRFGLHDQNSNAYNSSTTTDVQAQLYVFRQCRGWYEVLNENHQAIPHLTTVEQVRRAKITTFLIRRDLRCLAAPPELIVSRLYDSRATGDGPSLPPFPSSVIAMATAPETLQASVPEIVPAGTLMNFVTYLPHCIVKRGRKNKELGLILATKRVPNSSIRLDKLDPRRNSVAPQTYYIGLEDSTPAVFPPKFSISPVAGPENISGVHSLASILRKFRLPLSIRPILSSESMPNTPQLQTTALLNCGLSSIPSLLSSDRHFLRLQSLFRGDLLILSPVSSPEHLFVITPTMLRDHVFQFGTSKDPAYLRLLDNHRTQAANFLATAHPKDSLNYLVRHMRNVTREPRESYATRMLNKSRTLPPGSGNQLANTNSEEIMTQEELCRLYDELDEIYFYIRHGYYPSKNRRPETPIKTDPAQTGTARKPNRSSSKDYAEFDGVERRGQNLSLGQNRGGMPTAEELLEASLGTPVHNSKYGPKWANGSSATRMQPKEHGI